MKVTVERVRGHLVAETPGLSKMSVHFDAATALLTIRCPCLSPTNGTGAQRGRDLRLGQPLAKLIGWNGPFGGSLEQHPELVWKGTVVTVAPTPAIAPGIAPPRTASKSHIAPASAAGR